MRLRKKTWARPTLETCDFFVAKPTEYSGKWSSAFGNSKEICLELGCGKGGFISKLASSTPDKNFIAVDIKDEVLIYAKEKIEKEYLAINASTSNIKLTSHEIMIIHKMLNLDDSIKRIYINFCNPWYKHRHRARRLTHPNQLNQYKSFIAPNGEIWFKTDNEMLFDASIGYFEESGFSIEFLTRDLHASGFDKNIVTEHEKMYVEEGLKIKFLIARVDQR